MFNNFKVNKTVVNDIKINYRVGGSGPPILLLLLSSNAHNVEKSSWSCKKIYSSLFRLKRKRDMTTASDKKSHRSIQNIKWPQICINCAKVGI